MVSISRSSSNNKRRGGGGGEEGSGQTSTFSCVVILYLANSTEFDNFLTLLQMTEICLLFGWDTYDELIELWRIVGIVV